MLRSLYRLGFDWEALEYFAFVLEAVAGGGGDFELQIMYGIDGRKDLTESTLDHLSGWRNSRPVRVGNGAWDQHQNDVWGMLLDAVDIHLRQGAAQIVKPVWEGLAGFVDTAIAHAGDPDQGIWEIRGDPEHFTASKVLCWVAMDRGADMARIRQDHDRAEQWRKAADDLKAEILDQGVDSRGRFRQHYGNEELDASLLLIPILGFLPPDDERVRATVLAIADELTEDGLVLRYKVDTTDTGFEGKEGTFTICSFWLVTRPGHDRRAGACPGPVPEAARLRRAAAALRRGDRRRDRRTPGQLPPGLHPPGAHRRRRPAHRGRARRAARSSRPGRSHPSREPKRISAAAGRHGVRRSSMAEHYDVIIVGTGAGGGTLAHTLAPSGKRILLLGAGRLPPAGEGELGARVCLHQGSLHLARLVEGQGRPGAPATVSTTTSAARRSSTAPRSTGCGRVTSAS